jgi:thiol-disulfide isomerase/thioredoxin
MLLDLKTQEQFEAMWFLPVEKPALPGMRADGVWIQYHTATWCSACKRLDLPAIIKAAEEKGVSIWKIDVDVNEYTTGYCGVRSMPTFQMCIPKKIVTTLQSSDTPTVLDWIHKFL